MSLWGPENPHFWCRLRWRQKCFNYLCKDFKMDVKMKSKWKTIPGTCQHMDFLSSWLSLSLSIYIYICTFQHSVILWNTHHKTHVCDIQHSMFPIVYSLWVLLSTGRSPGPHFPKLLERHFPGGQNETCSFYKAGSIWFHCICVSMHKCMYACMHVCMCACIHACIPIQQGRGYGVNRFSGRDMRHLRKTTS